jgi:adenylate cyclase
VQQERGIALNPSDIGSYVNLCLSNLWLGRPNKSIAIADKAARLSPRDPYLPYFYWIKGGSYFMQERYDQAIEWERRSIEADPDFVLPLIDLAAALAQDHRDAEARDILASYRAGGGPARSIADVSSWARMVSNNSVWQAYIDRVIEGVCKAGMPEE